MLFFDTETCGYHGPTVLIQYAVDDGEIKLWDVWCQPIQATLELIESFCEQEVVAFNLSFDWFHLCQTYTTLDLLRQRVGEMEEPRDHIEEYAKCEYEAREGRCLKPKGALDLMLHARKGPYQSTMDRKDIRIRRVPAALAWELAKELTKRIPLKDIYFARFSDSSRRWQVGDITDDLGNIDPNFKDVYLKFAPSTKLKDLAMDALNIEEVSFFEEVEISKHHKPVEYGYAPYAMAIGQPGNWKGAWPDVIEKHINHWRFYKPAREYARKDVEYLQKLYHYFGEPQPNDDDSILAAMVGAVRWRGFALDLNRIRQLMNRDVKFLSALTFNFNSVDVVRRYLYEVMDETSKAVIQKSTKSFILEEISKWTEEEVCECGGFDSECQCDGGLVRTGKPTEAAKRARLILDARRAKKRIETFQKLLKAKRFHADVNVIGTLSSRMSGTGGLNAQGINREKEIRSCFKLADAHEILCGGDFEAFEVVLMDAAYGDPVLREKLVAGKKIHALFGTYLFPGKSYEDIMATKSLPEEQNLYGRSKNGVFCVAYGGNEHSLQNRVGISEQAANDAFHLWCKEHKVWGEERQKDFDAFCSMRQPGGLGTKVEWHDPQDYIESMFGFRRYFTLENKIVKALFTLAQKTPSHWKDLKIKVQRRDRIQTANGAVSSALYGAAFQVQAANMRAAGNHRIQSSGATITKSLQRKIWDLQPHGVQDWVVQPLNIHDEIMCPTNPDYVDQITAVVRNFVEEMRPRVPLIGIDWDSHLNSWAEK